MKRVMLRRYQLDRVLVGNDKKEKIIMTKYQSGIVTDKYRYRKELRG
jgi:hypothetical protein